MGEPYFRAPPMLVNVEFRLVLMVGITATRARPVAAAIRPYSIAVAPDSSFMKRANIILSPKFTHSLYSTGSNIPSRDPLMGYVV